MGEYITIGDSLLITVFSMIVVFVVLLTISYLIDLLRIATNGKGEKDTGAKEVKTVKEISAEENLNDDSNDEELVAVIAAAIAASMGVGIPDINIKSINRVSPSEPRWAEAGRRGYISDKL